MPAASMTYATVMNVGLYGKTPAHRDFISRGLPRAVADLLHDWMEEATAHSVAALGDASAAAWERAPCWRFAMPAGACGVWPVRGVVIPSADQAGRRFPLALLVRYLSDRRADEMTRQVVSCADGDAQRRAGFTGSPMNRLIGEPASNDGAPASPDAFPSEEALFAVLEAAARDASAGVSPTDRLHSRLEADVAAFSASPPLERESVWRGDTRSPGARSPGGLSGLGMPPPAAFAGMLTGDWSAFDPTPFKVTP